MPNMEYKVVDLGNIIIVDKKNGLSAGTYVQEVINNEAANGWKYHSMDVITQASKAGCLQKVDPKSARTYYMVIFERESK